MSLSDTAKKNIRQLILGLDTTPPPLGVLVLTYDFINLEEKFKAINSSAPNLDAYLIDINGCIIANSSNQSVAWQNRTVDINKIKQGLDYAPEIEFFLFNEEPLNGNYFTLEETGWTLLITAKPHQPVQIVAMISWAAGLLDVGGISTSEAIRKKMQNTTPAPDVSNITPPPSI